MARTSAMFRGSDGSFRDDHTGPLRRARARGDIGLWAWGRRGYPGESLTEGELPALLSLGLWQVEADQDWGLDWHLNEGLEVTFVTSGHVEFATEAVQHRLQRGWVSITRPWQRHRLGLPNVTACTLGWFVLDVGALHPNQQWSWPEWMPLPERDLDELTRRIRGNERCVWRTTPQLVGTLDRLEKTMREGNGSHVARLGLGIAETLLELAELLNGDEPDADPYYSSAERTVSVFLQNLPASLDHPWTIDSMAAECGLGRTRFTYYCRRLVSASPLDYLNGQRLDHAAQLLLNTDMSIADIAFACGYSSSQYFATVFRRHFGRSPTTGRERAAPPARKEGERHAASPGNQ